MIKKITTSVIILLCIAFVGFRFFNEPAYHHYLFVIKNGKQLFDDEKFVLNTNLASIEDRFESLYFLKLRNLHTEELDLGLMQLNEKLKSILTKLPKEQTTTVDVDCGLYSLNSNFFKNYGFAVIDKKSNYVFFTKKQIDSVRVTELCSQIIVPIEPY